MKPGARPLAGAAVVAVGSELLAPHRPDLNTPFLKDWLAGFGIAVKFTAVVPDDEEAIAETFTSAFGRCRFVFAAGGLGPTTDDLTRAAAARSLGAGLAEDADALAAIRERFGRRGFEMPEVNRKQALIPEGATALPNPTGTAPGVFATTEAGAHLILLPGPPAELAAMLESSVRPRLEAELGETKGAARATLAVAGLSESVLQENIFDLTPATDVPEELAILASGGEIELRVSGPHHRADQVARLADQLAERLGESVFTRTRGEHLEHAVGRLLLARGERVALAESLTGGLIAERLTRVPGSSGWFDLGVVSYANDAKRDLLGVDEDTLRAHGAVSGPVAGAMAEGVRRRSGNEWGLSVTGIAGPGGGSDEKPVGLVWIAVSGPVTQTKRFLFPGDRSLVRMLTATAALDLLRRALLAVKSNSGA